MVKWELLFEEYSTIVESDRRKSFAKLKASNHQLRCETRIISFTVEKRCRREHYTTKSIEEVLQDLL